MEKALASLHQRSVNAQKFLAYFLFVVGIGFAIFGTHDIVEAIATGRWGFAFFLPAMAVIFIVMGVVALNLSKKRK
jgi:uncharacterized membrane protein YpjA